MTAARSIISGALIVVLCALSVGASAASKKPVSESDGEFDAGKFTCLSYTNGMAPSSNTRAATMMAQIWVLGFLNGYYKASDKLEVSDDPADIQKLDEAVFEDCKSNPGASVRTVAVQGLASKPYKLPTVIAADLTTAYTCGQHLEAKNSAAVKADLAELWGFAIVEGIKAVAQPEFQIPVANKAAVMGAVNRSCGNAANKDKLYRDMANAVAEKVKMQ